MAKNDVSLSLTTVTVRCITVTGVSAHFPKNTHLRGIAGKNVGASQW